MKKLIPVLVCFGLLLVSGIGMAQDTSRSKVQWMFSVVSSSPTSATISAKATIEKGWGMFSVTMPDSDPNTRISLDSSVNGKITAVREKVSKQADRISEKNALLDIPVTYFKDEVELEFDIEGADASKGIKGAITYMLFKGEDFTNPIAEPFRFVIGDMGALEFKSSELSGIKEGQPSLRRTSIDLNNPVSAVGGTGAEGEKSLWRIFFLGILGGLFALIMPCTFPMIPMTVSFFTKRATDKGTGIRNAFLYGFFILLIYVLLSVPFYFLEAGNASILNNIATNAWLNLFFALVFFVFALSFFGLFEIGLPSSIANKADSKSDIGSLGGIFFMALTLAIVSFSCTGPILGTLLVGALNNNGGAFQLSVAMAGFGIALGLPFGLFAMFPRWLSKLPRSGSWMNTVKIVFGFVELALFIKFFSNADLVMHWGLLKRETFFLLWILIGLATTLYLFGILKFKHDPPPPKLGVGRKITGFLFLAFTLYLLPGLTNTKWANLSLISGFPPPFNYSWYKHNGKDGKQKGVEANVVNDYEKGLALAKKENKPVLLDFTGWACVNCRKMEENVWTEPMIKDLIEKNFILVSLYVDDRKQLPEEQQFLHTASDGSKVAIRTIGDKYATLQSENFKNASQPLYVVITPNEKLLTLPVGYTPNVQEYENWLKEGLKAFSKQ